MVCSARELGFKIVIRKHVAATGESRGVIYQVTCVLMLTYLPIKYTCKLICCTMYSVAVNYSKWVYHTHREGEGEQYWTVYLKM